MGVEEILAAVIERIPHPEGDEEAPLQLSLIHIFSNPEDDMVIPMPGEPAGAMLGSKMNTGNACLLYTSRCV